MEGPGFKSRDTLHLLSWDYSSPKCAVSSVDCGFWTSLGINICLRGTQDYILKFYLVN